MSISRFILTIFTAAFLALGSFAGGHEEGKAFNAGDMIMHHILDTHEWHVAGDLTIPLPIIIYDKASGLKMFSSSKFEHGQASYEGYTMDHEVIMAVDASGHVDEVASAGIFDFSITKNVVTLFLVLAIVVLIFTAVARGYTKNEGKAPTGIQSFFEPLIVFIRDEVALPVIGEKKYMKFMPYLLTVFFFIWIGNMLGLVPFMPGGANLTGNIAVALVLALCSFVLILINGNKNYWRHIFAMPGVPVWMLFILTPIEILGMFIRPLVLCIRLFANITAGHITILAFVSLIFILKLTIGDSAGWAIAPVSVLLSIFMLVIELLVAFLQAFIFTLLSATYFAAATEEAHH
jgi:F-type H+-transporting ATPase subunit a